MFLDLWQSVNDWLCMHDCGAIICGSSDSARVQAVQYISNQLQSKYGTTFPIYHYTACERVPTQTDFFIKILTAVGYQGELRKDSLFLFQQIITSIQNSAKNTFYRKAILIVEDAQKLSEKEYQWLIDIYNHLYARDIILTVLFFGSEKLKEEKRKYIKKGKEQIVHRYMIKEFEIK